MFYENASKWYWKVKCAYDVAETLDFVLFIALICSDSILAQISSN